MHGCWRDTRAPQAEHPQGDICLPQQTMPREQPPISITSPPLGQRKCRVSLAGLVLYLHTEPRDLGGDTDTEKMTVNTTPGRKAPCPIDSPSLVSHLMLSKLPHSLSAAFPHMLPLQCLFLALLILPAQGANGLCSLPCSAGYLSKRFVLLSRAKWAMLLRYFTRRCGKSCTYLT